LRAWRRSWKGCFFKNWRKKCWAKVEGHHILEVGVGTGKNFDYYPKDARITAIDFSEKMLKQAVQKRDRKNVNVDLELMDIQSLCFADNSFGDLFVCILFGAVGGKGLEGSLPGLQTGRTGFIAGTCDQFKPRACRGDEPA